MNNWVAAIFLGCIALLGCDAYRMNKLEAGVSTEAQVLEQFGAPHATYFEADGSKTLEYSRQPEGQVAYMIAIGTDGKMSALRQVLNLAEFAKITPGMNSNQVRRMLGKPAKMVTYDLKPDERHWEWRWVDAMQPKIFTVVLNPAGDVVSSSIADDPRELYKN
jgi:hypothetical protein